MSEPRVLVVGTTTDYVDWIRRHYAGRALFLTDPELRARATEPAPEPDEEVVVDLVDVAAVRAELARHRDQWQIALDGVACFDCESMELAATLAAELALPYPSVEAIRVCRDKYLSKQRWQQTGVDTPQCLLVHSVHDAVEFQHELERPCVLKPLSGSGSELVFRCHNREECEASFQLIDEGLRLRRHNRLYRGGDFTFVAEEYVDGVEYSCDFLLEPGEVQLIRLTRKIRRPEAPFGTIMAYLPLDPADLAGADFTAAELGELLGRAARALGLNRALCMVDFLVMGSRIVVLELSPRPGGDCLPAVLRHYRDLDIICATLDFARQRPLTLPSAADRPPCVGLRLHAHKTGLLMNFDASRLTSDARVLELHLIRQAGHKVVMPPEDYDSWYLGYVVFRPTAGTSPEIEAAELAGKMTVTIW